MLVLLVNTKTTLSAVSDPSGAVILLGVITELTQLSTHQTSRCTAEVGFEVRTSDLSNVCCW